MTSEECDNWATEQHPLLRENERISDIFPVELLLGKREGFFFKKPYFSNQKN